MSRRGQRDGRHSVSDFLPGRPLGIFLFVIAVFLVQISEIRVLEKACVAKDLDMENKLECNNSEI